MALLLTVAEGKTEHSKCLEFPTGQPNTHQKEKDHNHNHANDEVLALEKFHNAERFGIIVVQLAQFFCHLGHGQFVVFQKFGGEGLDFLWVHGLVQPFQQLERTDGVILGMEGQVWVRQNESLVHSEGQFR